VDAEENQKQVSHRAHSPWKSQAARFSGDATAHECADLAAGDDQVTGERAGERAIAEMD
jgi:hypothetical protein